MANTISNTIVMPQTSIAGGDTIANTTAATPFATGWTMPANFFTVGRTVRLSSRGTYSTLGALPGTFKMDLLGSGTTLATTGAQALSVGLTNDGWECKGDIVCISTGGAGTVEAQGLVVFQTAAITANPIFMVNTATVTLNMTASGTIGLQGTFSASGAGGNTITQRLLVVEIGGNQ